MSHERETKALSISVPIATVIAIVLAAIGWASSYWGNQYAQAESTGKVSGKVDLLEQRVSTNEKTTDELKGTVKTINDNVIKLLIKNNIEPSR